MQIFPFDKTAESVLTHDDLTNIQSNGISIRSGNKVLRFSVVEETVMNEDEALKQELKASFQKHRDDLTKKFEEYKSQMKESLDKEKRKLQEAQISLERQRNAISILPPLTEEHLHQGLSVAIGGSHNKGGLIWSYKTVYAPKMVGNRRIEADYAKRLVTPVVIEVRTDKSGKCFEMKVVQYIGNQKFHHYHGMSNQSDCWGQFKYSGRILNTPEDVIQICKEASFLLEVINDMSIGTRNPRGLSRFDTLCKHLLPPDAGAPEGNARTNSTNSRNERSGVTTDVNADISDNVWSV